VELGFRNISNMITVLTSQIVYLDLEIIPQMGLPNHKLRD
jgi:hypothetical protein